MSPSRAAGIDLGTSHCALARLDQGGRSAIIRSSQGDMLIPSVVYFEDDELLFGRAASQAAATSPQRTAEFTKRDFGQASYSRAIGGELLPVEVIEACLLKYLSADLPTEGSAAPAVVLAVPASFDQAQRRGMIDAARIAGLDVLGTIHDPLAAALALAEAQGYLSADAGSKPGCRVAVFDLGGGKLDVALLEIKPGRLRTLGIGGDARLGGRDWDLRLADYLAAQYAKQFGDDPRHDMVSVRRLLATAEEAKHTLSARQQAKVRVERQQNATDVVVARHAFEDATADLVERARRVAEDTLARAGMAWRDLQCLLLVGGATRMPMIASMVETLTGLKAVTSIHADEAVARGAVLYAELLLAAREGRTPAAPIEITDMTAHSLGIAWHEAKDGRSDNVVLIPRGTELPSGTSSKVSTDHDNQTAVEVQLVEGESRDADECRRIARLTISGLPPELPVGTPIEMHCQITADGRLQLKAQLKRSGQSLAIDVARDGGLSENEIADWKRLIEQKPGLKTIHAQLARHAQHRAAQAPLRRPAMPAVSRVGPPPAQAGGDGFELKVSTPTDRFRKSGASGRKIAIMLAGHVVFATLGLAIGYYILMLLRPDLNVLNLRLPGM
jgi:molecular chaperone DnaK